MYRKLSVIIVTFLLLFASCVSDNYKKLRSIEAYLNESPDSALVELHRMDEEGLFSQRDKALHALLMAEALDKSYVDDGQFIPVLGKYENYYSRHGSLHDKMLFYYYLGDQFSDSSLVTRAVRPFSKALELAEKEGNWFYCGMASEGLADLCYRTYDYDGYLSDMTKALGFFRKTGKQEHVAYAKVRMAGAYMNVDKPERAIELCREVVDSTADKENRCFALSRMALCYLSVEPARPDSTIWAVNRLYEESCPLNPYTYSAMARACAMTGNLSEYRSYIDSAYSSVNTRKDREYVLASAYYVLDRQDDIKSAYPVLKELHDVVDSISITSKEHSIASAQRNFYMEERSSERTVFGNVRFVLILFLSLAVCCICFVGVLFAKSRKKDKKIIFQHRKEQDEINGKYQGVLCELSAKEDILDRMAKHDESAEVIKIFSIVIERFISCGDRPGRAMLEELLKELYGKGELSHVLIRIADDCNAGAVGRLQALSTKKVPEPQILIFAMLSLGFSYETVSVVTGFDRSLIYTKVSRLRKTIISSESEDTAFLLRFLPDKSCRTKKN